jgi:hypothetical protein
MPQYDQFGVPRTSVNAGAVGLPPVGTAPGGTSHPNYNPPSLRPPAPRYTPPFVPGGSPSPIAPRPFGPTPPRYRPPGQPSSTSGAARAHLDSSGSTPQPPPRTGGLYGNPGATWLPQAPVLPPALGRPGGVPSPIFNQAAALPQQPPVPNAGQQDRFNQLYNIDPNVLWASQYNQEHGLNPQTGPVFGSDEVNTVQSLLPPRLMSEVQAGRMSLGGALNRYLQFLRGAGAMPQGPMSNTIGGPGGFSPNATNPNLPYLGNGY